MSRVSARAFGYAARRICIFLAIATCTISHAFTTSSTVNTTANAQRSIADDRGTSIKQVSGAHNKPRWTQLSPAQQQALAPLADEWDKLTANQKKKWLTISRKFASLKPDEQARLQDRMRDWVKLTPEQRQIARESYSRAKKLNPDQKAAEWQQYQQLSQEQKKKLADDAAARKRITNLPPASQIKGKLTTPAPKPLPHPNSRQPVESSPANTAATLPPQ